MKLHELKPAARSKKTPKRVDRGTGSGLGKSVGKGEKGRNTRSGDGVRPGSEGGQMSLYRKPPKRGFTNIFAKQYVNINVSRLNIFESGAEITPEVSLERRATSKVKDGAKVLGNGALEKNLTVKGCKFSKSAAGRIEATGGEIEVI